jgi:hypothetical protein
MKFFFEFLIQMYLLTIITNMFQNFDFAFVEYCAGTDNERTQGCHKKIKVTKDLNDDELVLNSSK